MDELYVLARRVLLDALEALGPHRRALVLVGAQAVYLRVGEADLAVSPYTTDADLVLDPRLLGTIPPLEQALRGAGFVPTTDDSVGVWVTKRATATGGDADVCVDLLVPQTVSPGKGRRAARLPGHDARAARIVRGLEGALVDADVLSVGALDPGDGRLLDVRVAGPAALLVAKVHKIDDRDGTDRTSDKDALDVLRLLRGTLGPDLAQRYQGLLADARSREVARHGLGLLASQFGAKTGSGIAMAVRSAGILEDADEITASCEALAGDLLGSLRE